MQNETETGINSLENALAAASLENVGENLGASPGGGNGIMDAEDDKPQQYNTHEKNAAPVAPTRGRKPGEAGIYKVRQTVRTFINMFPATAPKFRVLLSERVNNTPDEIREMLVAAIAEKKALTPDFLASLADREIGGILSLTEIAEKHGERTPVTIPRKLVMEYHEKQAEGMWAKMTAVNEDRPAPGTDVAQGLFNDDNDPTTPDVDKEIEKAEKKLADAENALTLLQARKDEIELAKMEAAEKAAQAEAEKADAEGETESPELEESTRE